MTDATPYWKTREYKNEKQRAWRAANPERALAFTQRAYERRRSTPEGWLAGVLATAKRRAARKGRASDIQASEIAIPTHCPILGVELVYGSRLNDPWSASLDRIEPSKGYVRGNVRVISRWANLLRGNCTDPEIFEALARDARRLRGE